MFGQKKEKFYVLSWNDEYLANIVVSGPLRNEKDAREKMQQYAKQRIREIHEISESEAEEIFDEVISAKYSQDDDAGLSIAEYCICITYDGHEERISVFCQKKEEAR